MSLNQCFIQREGAVPRRLTSPFRKKKHCSKSVLLSIKQDEISHLISELKEEMSQHNTIFKDISSVLKSLLKVSLIINKI